jgi:hypothetical protein
MELKKNQEWVDSYGDQVKITELLEDGLLVVAFEANRGNYSEDPFWIYEEDLVTFIRGPR